MADRTVDPILSRLSEAVALSLWETGAVKVNLENPFRLASGNYSPIYFNCRQVISNPDFMHLFVTATMHICSIKGLKFDMVAGGETAGIPFAAYIAQGMNLPMLYVRKAKKGYGLANLVEGGDSTGKRVLLIEDLITDGGSKLHFINVLRAAGATVSDVLVLFDRLQGGADLMRTQNSELHSVTDIDLTLEAARRDTIVSSEVIDSVVEYLNNPAEWHNKRGLEFV